MDGKAAVCLLTSKIFENGAFDTNKNNIETDPAATDMNPNVAKFIPKTIVYPNGYVSFASLYESLRNNSATMHRATSFRDRAAVAHQGVFDFNPSAPASIYDPAVDFKNNIGERSVDEEIPDQPRVMPEYEIERIARRELRNGDSADMPGPRMGRYSLGEGERGQRLTQENLLRNHIQYTVDWQMRGGDVFAERVVRERVGEQPSVEGMRDTNGDQEYAVQSSSSDHTFGGGQQYAEYQYGDTQSYQGQQTAREQRYYGGGGSQQYGAQQYTEHPLSPSQTFGGGQQYEGYQYGDQQFYQGPLTAQQHYEETKYYRAARMDGEQQQHGTCSLYTGQAYCRQQSSSETFGRQQHGGQQQTVYPCGGQQYNGPYTGSPYHQSS